MGQGELKLETPRPDGCSYPSAARVLHALRILCIFRGIQHLYHGNLDGNRVHPAPWQRICSVHTKERTHVLDGAGLPASPWPSISYSLTLET